MRQGVGVILADKQAGDTATRLVWKFGELIDGLRGRSE